MLQTAFKERDTKEIIKKLKASVIKGEESYTVVPLASLIIR